MNRRTLDKESLALALILSLLSYVLIRYLWVPSTATKTQSTVHSCRARSLMGSNSLSRCKEPYESGDEVIVPTVALEAMQNFDYSAHSSNLHPSSLSILAS